MTTATATTTMGTTTTIVETPTGATIAGTMTMTGEETTMEMTTGMTTMARTTTAAAAAAEKGAHEELGHNIFDCGSRNLQKQWLFVLVLEKIVEKQQAMLNASLNT